MLSYSAHSLAGYKVSIAERMLDPRERIKIEKTDFSLNHEFGFIWKFNARLNKKNHFNKGLGTLSRVKSRARRTSEFLNNCVGEIITIN